VTNTYVRDGVGVTAPVIRDTFASYTPGTSERRGTTTTFNHSGLKNAEMQTDASKAVSATKVYDAFGNLTNSAGTWQGAFGYAGRFGYQEDASGLKLLGHRYYDSSTGRFLTRDPAQDGRNWYVYCNGDTVASVDPNGLQSIFVGIGASALVPIPYPGGMGTGASGSTGISIGRGGFQGRTSGGYTHGWGAEAGPPAPTIKITPFDPPSPGGKWSPGKTVTVSFLWVSVELPLEGPINPTIEIRPKAAFAIYFTTQSEYLSEPGGLGKTDPGNEYIGPRYEQHGSQTFAI
jgi:RHS repeat-associated protein